MDATPAKTFDQGKEEVTKLCRYFTINREAFLAHGVNEAHVCQSLIEPLFEALGWDVRNKAMIAPQYREVIPEDRLDVEGQQRAPDYTFRVGSLPKFYAEAKKCDAKIGTDPAPAFQLRRYGWSAKLAVSILTDFEELAVYDCTMRPSPSEKASRARIHYFHFQEYPDRWRELWDVFSREAVWSGAFDQYARSKRKRGTSEVDEEFLKEMERWRLALAGNIALRNKKLTLDELNAAVQLTIDRVVFLRMAEDRGLEPYEQLLKLCERPDIYSRFMHELSRRADEKYNSGLFHFERESGVSDEPDRITPKLAVDDKVFKPILQSLYFAHGSPYQFGVMPVEILGTVYERFLGRVIRLTAGHQARIEAKPQVRKAGGVYYTPAYIVEYIVQQTVARQIEGKSPAQLADPKNRATFRILDMACGSGSFLLGAYRHLLDHCLNWYTEHRPESFKKAVYKDPRNGHWRLTIEEKKRILTTHLFGVDIDPQAAEVTKLSLLLKVLEGENDQSFSLSLLAFGERALPNLSNNIKCGNSLVGADYFTSTMFPDPEEIMRVNPFDWGRSFPDAIGAGGFDCIVGNPPYVRPHNLSAEFKKYLWAHFRTFTHKSDLYCCFIENGTRLLKAGGLFSYIVSHGWLRLNSFQELRRFVLDNHRILQLVEFPYNVFADAKVATGIFVFERGEAGKNQRVSIIGATKIGDNASFGPTRQIPQASFRQTFQNVFDTSISPETELVKDKMRAGIPIGARLEICFGLKTGDDERFLHHTKGLHPQDRPLLRGDDVRRYQINYKGEYVWYVPRRMRANRTTARPGEPARFEQPKLLVKDTSKDFSCTYESGKYYAKDVVIVIPKPDFASQYDLRFVAGVINSTALRFYYRTTFKTIHVQNEELASLPLPQVDFSDRVSKSSHDRVVALVDSMLGLHTQLSNAKSLTQKSSIQRRIDAADAEIDRLVYGLYGLTAEEIALIVSQTSEPI